ncbi:MAG: hypothetical protein ACXWL2_00435 [Candidatus Chromulinivorax sp.]
MKKFLLIILMLFFGFESNTVDIPALYKSTQENLSKYRHNLLNDTPTQISTVLAGTTIVIGYKYYLNKLAQVCLDDHPNSEIMYKSKLYMRYSDFLGKIELINSYEDVINFINMYCIDSFGYVDLNKINTLIALINDLQTNNNRRTDVFNRNEENGALNTFKQALQVARANYKEQLTYDAMIADKNAQNVYTLSKIIQIIAYILNAFDKK